MELEHKFTVAAPVAQAWEVLQDLDLIAPCMPGATLTSYEGDEFTGNVKVKLGPVMMTFAGQGRFVERDAEARRMVIEASGKDKRGGGTARATVRATLRGEGDSTTTAEVHTDLSVTGRAAQFGRGMIADVSGRLLGQFTDCLAGKLGAAPEAGSATAATDTAATDTAAADTATAGTGTGGTGTGGAAQPPGQPGTGATAPPAQPAAVSSAEPAGSATPASHPPETASGGEPARAGGGRAARQPAGGAEPIDLLGVTGMRSGARRLLPYLIVFLVGAVVGGVIIGLLVG